MTSQSNSWQSTRPTGRVLGKNYSSFLDFTCNYVGRVEFLSPDESLLVTHIMYGHIKE